MTISDVYPSFDSDQLPGSAFGTFTGDLSGLDVDSETDLIGTNENLSGSYFVGQIGAPTDNLCTAKDIAPNLGEVRGICPEEPDRKGSYYLAGLSYWAKTTDLRTDLADDNFKQSVDTYSVALNSPIPKIELQVGTSKVRVIPACYNQTKNNNAALVNFEVVSMDSASGKFYVNWEDSEQGGDYDQDADGYLYYEINGSNITFKFEVTNSSTP